MHLLVMFSLLQDLGKRVVGPLLLRLHYLKQFLFKSSPLPFSLIAGQDTEQVPMPVNEEDNRISSSHDKVATGAPLEETCEFLSEASMEVPTNINENDAIANDSQNSSSMRYEELSQDLSQPISKNDMVDNTSDVVKKQQGNKMSRYNRRGRSRGFRGRGK